METLATGVRRPRNRWFEERRHLFVRNLLKEFTETLTVFIALYEKNLTARQISFDQINRLVGRESEKGLLWRLKDHCHQLWRDTNPHGELNGCLLDWVMGSLFHEAMKLKENIYMYQYYGPLAKGMGNGSAGGTIKLCGIEFERFMDRTDREIEKQIETLGIMFGRANYLLRTIMLDQAENPLLVRYLVENEQVVETLWSESLIDLFRDMFGGQPEEGFCLAARSYLEGDWHQNALNAYAAALAVNPDCEEARTNSFKLQALLR